MLQKHHNDNERKIWVRTPEDSSEQQTSCANLWLDWKILNSVVVLLNVAAVITVRKIPIIIGLKIHMIIFGVPIKMKGSIKTSINWFESWIPVNSKFEERTKGVAGTLQRKK